MCQLFIEDMSLAGIFHLGDCTGFPISQYMQWNQWITESMKRNFMVTHRSPVHLEFQANRKVVGERGRLRAAVRRLSFANTGDDRAQTVAPTRGGRRPRLTRLQPELDGGADC